MDSLNKTLPLARAVVQQCQKRNTESADFLNRVLNYVPNVDQPFLNSSSHQNSHAPLILPQNPQLSMSTNARDDDAELQSFLSDTDDEDDIVPTNPYFDQFCFSNRNEEMSTNERIMLLLLHQARFNSTNRETELFAQTLNSLSLRNCCQLGTSSLIPYTDWNTLASKMPNAFTPTIHKYFYAKCGELIGPISDLNKTATCINNHDSCLIMPKYAMKVSGSFFCYVSLTDWLHHQVPLMFSKLRLKRAKESKFFHDLSTCDRYSQLVNHSSNNIDTLTLTLTWDGVAFTKDQSQSMWPLCAYLNELPFQARINNSMLIALHSGNTKPKSDIMLRPLVDELVALEHNPLSISIDGTDKLFTVKVLLFIADAPARAIILNCAQYNSLYGCHCCEIQGQYDKRFNTMLFPAKYKSSDTVSLKFKLRKDTEWRQMANTNDSSIGVKGPSQLMRLPYIDMPTICPPEPMHSQYLGTVKSIMERWLGKDLANKQWYKSLSIDDKKQLKQNCLSSEQLHLVNQRLASIKFPEHVLKSMPQLQSTKSLKSLDYELLLFYGWPVFDDLIDPKRLYNFKQLAFIMSTLSARMVSKRVDMRYVDSEVASFFDSFFQIYNKHEAFMWKINLHYIVHLTDMVRNYGPLTVQTAYFTENTMGLISRRVKTGTNVSQQVMKKCLMYQSIVSSCSNNIDTCSHLFLESLYLYLPKLCSAPSNSKTFASNFVPTAEELQLLSTDESTELLELQRVNCNGIIICTKAYNETKATSTLNHCIKSIKGKYYIVTKIIQALPSANITLLTRELLNCKKLPLRSNDKSVFFSYAFTFSKVSNTTTSLELIEFAELASYTSINGTNYLFVIFNKHL